MSVINSKLQINYILSNIINTTFWYNSKKLKTPVNFLQTQYDKVSWIKSGCLDLEPLIVLLIADCAPPYILYPPYKMYWIRNRPSPRKGKRKKMKKQIFFYIWVPSGNEIALSAKVPKKESFDSLSFTTSIYFLKEDCIYFTYSLFFMGNSICIRILLLKGLCN